MKFVFGPLLCALIATPASGQYALPLTSIEVDLAAYGISGPEEVRRGRLSIAYKADSLQVAVYYLRTDPVQPRVTYADPPPMPEPSTASSVTTRETALWVWQTALILRDASERATFLDFIERQGITRVFLYLASAEGERASAGYIPFSSEELGPLLADLRGRGALAYALDGDKDYVLQRNHPGVFRTIERLVEHNSTASATTSNPTSSRDFRAQGGKSCSTATSS